MLEEVYPEQTDENDKENTPEELEQKLKETEEKLSKLKIEHTVEKNRLIKDKSRFIDNLSHDLATPITPLISLLPMIKDELQDDGSKQLLDTCIRNVEYIKRVINNARELADIEATDFIFKKENLYQIIDELVQKYDVVFKSYNVKVQNNINKDVFVKTEKNRLIQLFDHVTSNAINSMQQGGCLTFQSKPVKKDEKEAIQITISDTGVGLTRDQTDRIFDEFYKTDDSRHKLDSTGLGLTICRAIVKKHSGKIWADSHGQGKGTSIHFTVPTGESIYSRSF